MTLVVMMIKVMMAVMMAQLPRLVIKARTWRRPWLGRWHTAEASSRAGLK